MNVIINSLKLARFQYLPIILIPIFAGAFFVIGIAAIYQWKFWFCLIGAIFAHLGANVANDYFDWTRGTDKLCRETTPELDKELICGSNVLANKLLSERQAVFVMIVFFGIALVFAVVLAVLVGWPVLLLAFIGFCLGFFYCAPWISFGYVGKGLGEIAIILAFGFLPFIGTYYVLGGNYYHDALIASIPIGLLGALVLFHHHYSHIEVDRACNKMSLPVVLGEEKSFLLLKFVIFVTIILIIVNSYFGIYPVTALISILPLFFLMCLRRPLNVKSAISMMKKAVPLIMLCGFWIVISFVL